MLLASGIITLLILLTALFVAAEFAVVGARRSRLRRLAEDGNALATRVLPVVEDPHALDRYIAASQVGITLCSLILGAYAQASIAPRVAPLLERLGGLQVETAESTSAVLVLLILTTLAMIVGELVPKSIALQDPTRTAMWTVVPMQWAQRAFAWSIDFLNGSGNLILKLMRVKNTGHRHVHSPEEIELLIAESRDGGLLEPQEQVRLHQALRLGLRTARELMVPRSRLASVDVSTPFAEVLRLVATSPYSRLPVYRGSPDDIIGILHTKDIVTGFISDRPQTSLMSLLRPLARVHGSLPADHLLNYMRDKRIHQVLVVGDGGTDRGVDHARRRRGRAHRRRLGRIQGRPCARDSPARRQREAPRGDARGPGSAGPRRRLEEPWRHGRHVHPARARRRAGRWRAGHDRRRRPGHRIG